jgi:formylglycine-generating enzyme required for sulfatase activity
MMGSPKGEEDRRDNEKQHEVKITRGFWITETVVTQGRWRDVTGNNPSRFGTDGGQHPVEQVTWFDAVAFANVLSEQADLPRCYELVGANGRPPGDRFKCNEVRLLGLKVEGYRLPTEAEWEYACRAGTASRHWCGDSEADLERVAWYKKNSENRTQQVGVKGANTWGLADVHGNVWEWVWDWHADYAGGSETNPVGPGEGSSRVIRGGGWGNLPDFCRSAIRSRCRPNSRNSDLGFRLVRTTS